MLFGHILFILALSFLAWTKGAVIAEFDKGKYRLHTDFLESKELAQIPLYTCVMAGNQGDGKTTLTNAVARVLGIKSDLLLTHDLMDHCTKDVQITAPSKKGILPLDRPGQNKGGVSDDVDSAHVDLMTTQLTAPIANVLIQFCAGDVKESDLESMSLYGDERLHLSDLSPLSTKPDLIIVVKTAKTVKLATCKDSTACTEQEYLDFSVRSNHPVRKAFNSINLVFMPLITGAEVDHLSYENFHPEKVPKYWDAIKRIADMLNNMADKIPADARLTGSDLSVGLRQILPDVNAKANVSIPSMRSAVLLNKVKSATLVYADEIQQTFAPYISDPFHADHVIQLDSMLRESRAAVQTDVLRAYHKHHDEADLWLQIEATVSNELDSLYSSTTNAAEKSKGVVLAREQNAYNTANTAMSTARTSLTLDGVLSTVEEAFVKAMREAISVYKKDAVQDGVTPSPAYHDKLQHLLSAAEMQWSSAHDANFAVYKGTRERLQATPTPVEVVRISDHLHTCSNQQHTRTYNLGERFPQYFSPENKAYLYSVRSRFDGSGGGEGNFNLGPGVGEQEVSNGGLGGRKWNGNKNFYNPQNTVLRVWVAGGGWGGGVCSNPIIMNHIDLSITQNALALPKNSAYRQSYVKPNRAPVF